MAPLQFKGEIMDFDLGMEIDHRKRYDGLRARVNRHI